MKNFKHFLTLFLITTLTAFSVNVWGTEATLNSVSTKDVATAAGASVSLEFDGVTCTCTRHSSNQPGFYTSSGIVRYYANDVMTLSVASGNTITQIDFVMTSGTVGTASPGTLTGNQWKGSAESVSFTGGGTVKISSITVTYSSGGGSTYTVTLDKNGNTSDITGCSGTYTLPTTGEHVANACEGWAWHCWTNAAYSTGSPTTTAPSSTVITSMTSAGTAYAVYKHEEASGGSSNVTFTAGTDKGSTTSTTADDMTKGGVTISSTSAGLAYAEYRFYSGTITISSTSGNITSIEFTCTSTGYANALGDGTVSAGSISASGSTATWTGNSASFTLQITAQSRVSTIVVTTSSGVTTTYTSSPDCAECMNKVTLTKGTPEHGSFLLDKADGAHNNCAAGGLVVTVSGITPADGYQFKEITQTGIASGVTINQTSKTVTYAKDVAGASTINVVFEAIPTYTVTLNKNGSTSDITGCTGTYTLPTTGEHVANACEGWAWHCWTNAAYAESTTAPSTTVITSMTSAGTAYAVYKHEETSGGSSNVTFTAGTDQGSTMNTSSDAMTKGGITISSTSAAFAYDDNYRFYSGGTITISSSGENITSIIFNSTASGTASNGPGNISGTGYSYSGKVGTWTGNAASVSLSTTAQSRATSIVVTTGGGSTTTYTSSPDCTPCDYKVTLTKGEESHGTFTLDKTNGVYNNCTSNFVVTVSGISPVSGYYCTGVTATGDHNEVSGPDGSGNYTVTYTKGNSITSTITANFAPNPTYTVTWSMNGDESNTEEYEEGESIVFPGSADGCDGKVFRGWSADPVAETDVEPTYVTSATMPAHAVTYYAVYAEASTGSGTPVTLLSEDFSSITNGNSTSTSGSSTSWSGNANIEYVNTVYQAGGAIRIGASGSGSIETIALSATAGSTLTVSFDVKGWTTVEGNIRVTVTGCDPEVISYTATMSGSFENKSAQFTLTTDNPTVTIATTAKRAFIDNIVITGGGGTTYSGYTTTCGAGISAKNIGWITAAAGKKVKRVINVSARNFDDPTTLAVTCTNSNFDVTLGATAVPAGATGLTTTLTVEYTPSAPSMKEENVEIVLTAGDKTRTITVNGRSVPDDFLLITKKSSTWYALPANMNSGSNEYDGVEVSPNDATTPTAVAVSPSTVIYNLASVANSRYADNGHLVRLVGNGTKCLWGNKATGATKVNIQNYAALSESNGDNYEWDLKTTDGVHYFVESPCNAEYAEGRRLAYGTKFGMYKEESVFYIVSAGCTSQPGDVVVNPRRVEATFSWVSNASSMAIDLYTNELMTEGHKAATASSSPYIFTGLDESKPYWYRLTPDGNIDCAVTGSFTTSGPLIDIVEWQQNGVVLFIDKGDINPKIVIDGQEEHGSITGGGNATKLFFAKYFEGEGSMKLISIYNGTGSDISLSGYKINVITRSYNDKTKVWNTSDNEYDISSLGTIKAGQEIIFFSRPLSSEPVHSCADTWLTEQAVKNGPTDNPRWIECVSGGTYINKSFTFNGNDALQLIDGSTVIDCFGAATKGIYPSEKNCRNEECWKAKVRNMDYGKSASDFSDEVQADMDLYGIDLTHDSIEGLATARSILFRDSSVTCGDDAVTQNTATFATFSKEWNGRNICGSGTTGKGTCNSFKDLAGFDYNEYYIDWHNLDPGTELNQFTSDPDTKEYTIPIDDMRQYACLKLRFQLVHEGNVLTEAAQQVPIVVVGDNVDTNDPLFSELVIDQTTHLPSYSHSVERCKDCDVVILGSAKLTKGPNENAKDVPEVGNIKVYPGGKLVIPTGTEYTVKSLALRRQEDVVASANIQGTLTFKTAASPAPARQQAEGRSATMSETPANTYFDLRIDPTNWHFITLPYDVKVSDIRFANPEETAIPVLGSDYLLQWYNGERRAATKNDDAWEPVNADATLKKGLGYIFALPGDGKVKREFRFPMSNDVITEEATDKFVESVYGYGCDQPTLGSNHKGWNLIGSPYLMPYTSDIESPLRTGLLIEDHSPEHDTPTWDGSWTDNGDGLYYIAIPINNGWDYYYQDAMANYPLEPFTSYFVQIGGSDPAAPQGVDFKASQVPRSIVRRAPQEYEDVEDTHPVWCEINLTNPQGETDKTTFLVSNQFTDEYDMMKDFVKMRGGYYSYYTRPVLASRNNEGEMAFNALPDASAIAGIPLNYFAATKGNYTIAYNDKYDKDQEVKEVKLWDKTTEQWYDLMTESYTFTSNRVDNKDRFIVSIRVERKGPQITTGVNNWDSETNGPRKILRNGHLLIIRGGNVYDVTGKEVQK